MVSSKIYLGKVEKVQLICNYKYINYNEAFIISFIILYYG
jgi:hypothetical protein